VFGDRFTYYPMVAHFWLYIGLAMRAAALQRDESAAARAQREQPRPAAASGHPRLALVNRWNPPLAHLPEDAR